ncbi:MAG: hypothetical protein KDD84_19910 [Caldilineaceae bacterium]|nr:hypothetical protein [Caldilineaceae bacterium]
MTLPASTPNQERFDLSRFVLDYLEQEGGVVAAPGFGVYEALLPEHLASELGIADFVRLYFGADETNAAEDILQLSVAHPLIEDLAERVLAQPANATLYINNVRLQKRGLLDLARKEILSPNARVEELPRAEETRVLHHYVQLNYKVTIIGEEKQEEMVSLVMDLQSGHAIDDADLWRQTAIFDFQPGFDALPLAPIRWRTPNPPVDNDSLEALLPRAEKALQTQLNQRLTSMAERIQHHLELDQARIEEYYDEMAADLRRRQSRLSPADDDRSRSLEDKLSALQAERQSKANDIRGRYSLRVEHELVSVLQILQPKVTLAVNIANRSTSIQRTVVWDPLLHRLEPLVCDVCGLPGKGLSLCTGGHLAHEACLAPQCVDCKRVHCQLCADQIDECVVCHRPVCRTSLITCPTCKRGTCNEHQNMCHAADGQPASLETKALSSPQKHSKLDDKKASSPAANSGQAAKAKAQPKQQISNKKSSRAITGKKDGPPVEPTATGTRIQVEIYETEPTVVAFVMRSTSRIWATRVYRLTREGIHVTCDCEKSPCPAHGFFHLPAPTAKIEEQIAEMITKLRAEYHVPAKKVSYLRIHPLGEVEIDTLHLDGLWRDEEWLTQARRGFKVLVSRS